MTLPKTALFAGLFLVLGVYIYLYEWNRANESSGKRLVAFDNHMVRTLTLHYPDQKIELQRDLSGLWNIIHPMEVTADVSTVQQVLSSLRSAEVKRIVEPNPTQEDLQSFGLNQPKLKISILTEQGHSLPQILLGDLTPVGHSLYVMREGETAVLLSTGSLLSSLEKTVKDFRDKNVLNLPVEAMHRISLEGEKGNLVLARSREKWFIEKPKALLADTRAVRDLLSTLSRLSAVDFAAEESQSLKTYGLDRPRLRITLYSEDRQKLESVIFGAKRENKAEVYLAKNPPQTIYTVYESVFHELDKDWSSLRNKDILTFSKEDVHRLRIDTSETSIVLVKSQRDIWELNAPKRGSAKKGAVEDYLTTLAQLRAIGFGDAEGARSEKTYGFGRPQLKVLLETRDGNVISSLLVGGKTGSKYYAKQDGNPVIYLIDSISFQHLSKQPNHFMAPQSGPFS